MAKKKKPVKEFQIHNLGVDWAVIEPATDQTIAVHLNGTSGPDFVACCNDGLLREIIYAAGEALCREVHGIDEA